MSEPRKWTPATLASQSGKVFAITGANSGLGLEAAKILAGRGAHLVLLCRTETKAQRAMEEIKAQSPRASLSFVPLDLADLSSVRRAAEQVRNEYEQLHALINNAGVMALPRRETADGFEMQLGTNHLGHFAFTAALMPQVEAAQGRVVNVSSIYHKIGRMKFDDLMGERSYEKWTAYAQSKLANVLFTLELERRLRQASRRAIAVACHPGYASTNLQMVGPEMSGSGFMRGMMKLSNTLVAQSSTQGSWPTVYAAAGEHAQGGGYYGPNGIGEVRGRVGVAKLAARARDTQAAQRLWDASLELTGASWNW